jgi:hypothetical protein
MDDIRELKEKGGREYSGRTKYGVCTCTTYGGECEGSSTRQQEHY